MDVSAIPPNRAVVAGPLRDRVEGSDAAARRIRFSRTSASNTSIVSSAARCVKSRSIATSVHTRLRRHDVFVPDGLRWSDRPAKLLDGAAWQQSKDEVLASLELPEDPQTHLQELAAKLETAYRVVAEPSDADQQAPATVDAQGRLQMDKLAPQESPDKVTELSRRCQAMLPRVDLPDLIMEVHG